MQIPAHISQIASRSDGSSFSIILRLSTLVLSATLFILSTVEVSRSGYWWFLIPSTIYFAWQTCILVLAHRGIKIAMPVAITLDLLMWLSAVTFIALSWLFNAGFVYQCGESRAYCAPYWITWRISIASQAIIGLITVIHFTLFIRDIMALRRAKRAAAKNFVELTENSFVA